MIIQEKAAMNEDWKLFHLGDALEESQGTLEDLEKDPEIVMPNSLMSWPLFTIPEIRRGIREAWKLTGKSFSIGGRFQVT